MTRCLLVAMLAAIFVFSGSVPGAEARRRLDTVSAEPQELPFWEQADVERRSTRRSRPTRWQSDDQDRPSRRGRTFDSASNWSGGVGPRPGKWCGWYMRTRHGGGPEYNLARNWRNRGTPISGPQVGAIVVWNHHVGEIVGQAGNGKWIVLSGNDSGRVRERARSVSGASFRML